jgi:hypothetical protein
MTSAVRSVQPAARAGGAPTLSMVGARQPFDRHRRALVPDWGARDLFPNFGMPTLA